MSGRNLPAKMRKMICCAVWVLACSCTWLHMIYLPTCTLFKWSQIHSRIHSCFPQNSRSTTLPTHTKMLPFNQTMEIVSTHFVCNSVEAACLLEEWKVVGCTIDPLTVHMTLHYSPGVQSDGLWWFVLGTGQVPSIIHIQNIFLCTLLCPWNCTQFHSHLVCIFVVYQGQCPRKEFEQSAVLWNWQCSKCSCPDSWQLWIMWGPKLPLFLKSIAAIPLGSWLVSFNTPLGETVKKADLSFLLS